MSSKATNKTKNVFVNCSAKNKTLLRHEQNETTAKLCVRNYFI